MFIEKLKDEILREKFEEHRGMLRAMMAGGDMSNSPFADIIKENKELMRSMDKPVTYALPVSGARIIKVGETIEVHSAAVPYEILEHFIRAASHRFIMNFCMCRESMDCKDYPRDIGCLFMGESAKNLNPELGRLAGVEEALQHIKRCREAGLIFNTGYVPGDALMFDVAPANRFMSVCACCQCCCITKVLGKWKPGQRRLPGVEVHVSDSCTGCSVCVDACVYGLIQLEDGKAITDPRCIACGRCANACPEDAVEVRVSDHKYIEKAIEILSRSVDVT